MTLRFAVLGPVEVLDGTRAVPVPMGRARVVLAMLAVHANRPVSIGRLVDAAWNDHPPPSARTQIHGLVLTLRRALAEHAGPDREAGGPIATGEGGYLLRIDAGDCDALEFVDLLARARAARAADDPAGAVDAFDRALGLWRGPPFEGVTSRLLEVEAAWLTEERLAAVQECVAAELSLGRAADAVARLAPLVELHPLHEGLRGLMMVALCRAGRRAEALATFQQVRRLFVEELGVEPGTELSELHRQVLRGDLDRGEADQGDRNVDGGPDRGAGDGVDRGADRDASVPVPAPHQLPPAAHQFTGRAAELTALNGLLRHAGPAGAAIVSVIHGSAGVGKTTLAVHWAHQVADAFPDGQLYADLRGFDPHAAPLAPAEVARCFLDALGVPLRRIPVHPAAQIGLYRSCTAGKRMLVLLDNARDAEQVRPLLPGSSASLVVVTSRHQLTGLVAAQGARPLALGLLTADETWALLAGRLGKARLAAEPSATDELIGLSAGLPLAVAVLAARVATRPDLPLAALADELREAPRRLDALDTGDPASDVRSVLSLSYRNLPPGQARLFRLLGLHTGPDVTPAAAASLAGLPPEQAGQFMAELARAHLVTERAPGRYTFHDLLRHYARELAEGIDGPVACRAAVGRVLDHYVHTAHRMALRLDRQRDPIVLAPPVTGVTVETIEDRVQARAWFGAEITVLLASVGYAARSGYDTHAWQLAWSLSSELDRRGRWHDWVATQRYALDCARRTGDATGQAYAHRLLGRAYLRLGRFDDAASQLDAALRGFLSVNDPTGAARTHVDLAMVHERRGAHPVALWHARMSLDLHRAAGHRAGQARARGAVGWYHALLGDHREAIAECRLALALHLTLGDRQGQAETLASLGYAHHCLGRYPLAIAYYRRALYLYGAVAAPHFAAATLVRLGDTHLAAGDPDAAGRVWTEAFEVLVDVGHPDTHLLRRRIAELGATDRGPSPAVLERTA